jgi:hypothetical protein
MKRAYYVTLFLIVVLVAPAPAQRKRRPRAPAATPTTTITPAKISRDLNGHSVYDVDTPSGQPANWQFRANEPKAIEIYSLRSSGNEAAVRIHILTATPDGSSELGGTLGLRYVRSAGKWRLLEVTNQGADIRVYTANTRPPSVWNTRPPENTTPPTTLINSAFTIAAGRYQSAPFTLDRNARVFGDFIASGGDVEVFILDEYGLTNFHNRAQAQTYYNSGRVITARIDAYLAPGNYFLIFNNGYSLITPKAVTARVFIQW